MARTSAKAKKTKQEVIKGKTETADSQPDKKESENEAEKEDDYPDKENDSSNFEIEKIIHTRVYRGKRQYLVRWKGYDEEGDTWENESALESCTEALEVFKNSNPSKDDEGDENKETDKKSAKTTKKNAATKSEDKKDDEDKSKGKKRGKSTKKSTVPPKKAKEQDEALSTRPKKKNEPKDAESDDESVTDGKNYEVEKILEVHTRRDGSREFLIRWKGYRPSDDTWEPEAHLDCPDLIEKFMKKVDKAKEIPARQLRESKAKVDRFVPNEKLQGRSNLRRNHNRPSYAESYAE